MVDAAKPSVIPCAMSSEAKRCEGAQIVKYGMVRNGAEWYERAWYGTG